MATVICLVVARGFMRAGQGNPDEARAARYLLKDYVNAKLLFCHPPPGEADDAFNQRTREICLSRASKKKRAPVTRVGQNSDTFVRTDATSGPSNAAGMRSRALDQDFFAGDAGLSSRPFVQGSARDGKAFTRGRLYPHQNMVSDDGSELTGRRARIAAVLSSAGADGLAAASKKHKKMRRVKQRSGKGYD
jgi:large subunit GTPase 1